MSDDHTRLVNVDLGDRAYNIHIGSGLLDKAASLIKPQLNSARVATITDETVSRLYGKKFQNALKGAGLDVIDFVRPAGEGEKSFNSLRAILDGLLDAGFTRKDTVIALGGGVIGDLTGFAASVFKRGCGFIQVPTTLLAQVDSSVGGKTAINVPQGKNLIGAFYQPSLVLADTSVLETLPERELKAGYAEVLKYGLLGDAEFFNWLEENSGHVLDLKPEALAYAIATSCQTKARIVAEDERETGVRALLNLGHTFGHALEAEAGYNGQLLHGEAVSAGMQMAFEFSTALGLCSDEDAARLYNHLERNALTRRQDLPALLKDPRRLLAHMGQDKKNDVRGINLILARKIGEAYVHAGTDTDVLLAYLTSVSKRNA